MNLGKKMLWGGLGWALGGPIGAIIGYSFASMSGQYTQIIVAVTKIELTQKHSLVILLYHY